MQTTPTQENELLENCPWCDYNLTGLPVEHICPECGHPVNRRTLVIGRRAPSKRRLFLKPFLIMAIGYWVALLVFLLAGMIALPFALILEVYLVSCLGAGLLGGLLRYNRPQRLTVSDEGLMIERPSRQPEVISWNRVERADQGWNKRILRVQLTDRPRRLFVECSNAHPDDVQACIRAINARAGT